MAEKDYYSKGLRFITGYRYASGILKTLNDMTFLYNPVWEYNSENKLSMPIAFFHVKSFNEVMESDVQTKKVMFYNSENVLTSDMVKGSTLNVIADNIVNKPKTYKMEVVVPYEGLTMLFNSALMADSQVPSIANFIATGRTDRLSLSDNLTRNVNAFVEEIDKAQGYYGALVGTLLKATFPIKAYFKLLVEGIAGLFTGVSSALMRDIISIPKYNKISLESMWKSRTLLKMKMWDGWNFKYVVITDINIKKESTEMGVEEATITCTEVPIMTMKTRKAMVKPTLVNTADIKGGSIGALAGAETARDMRNVYSLSVPESVKNSSQAIANGISVEPASEGIGLRIRY